MNKKTILFIIFLILGTVLLKGFLKAPVAVSGTVEFDGKPIESVKIKLYQLKNIKRYWETHTDKKGRFSFELEQLPDEGSDYVIQAEQYLYLKQNVWSQIFRASEKPLKFNISLKGAVSVKGRFVDKKGIAFEYIDLLFRNGDHSFLAKTSYGGEFDTDLLPNAHYLVYATQLGVNDNKSLREFGELTIGNEDVVNKNLISNVDIKFPYIKDFDYSARETYPGYEDKIKVIVVGKPWLKDLQYIWSATGGNIKGTGDEITWVSPEEYGKYTITVKAVDPEGDFAEHSFEIKVGERILTYNPGTYDSGISKMFTSIFKIFDIFIRELKKGLATLI